MPFSKLPAALVAFIAGRDDSDLLVRLRRREPEAVGLLYDRYGKASYSLALRIVKDASVAEDTVSEAMLKLWNRVIFFKETRCSALGLWFMAITFIQAREYIQQKAGTLSGNSPRESGVEKPILFQDWPKALDAERVDETHLGLILLTPEERNVLDAGFFEAIPFDKLADHVGISPADIQRVIGAALRKLVAD